MLVLVLGGAGQAQLAGAVERGVVRGVDLRDRLRFLARRRGGKLRVCLLYTSDAADE